MQPEQPRGFHPRMQQGEWELQGEPASPLLLSKAVWAGCFMPFWV